MSKDEKEKLEAEKAKNKSAEKEADVNWQQGDQCNEYYPLIDEVGNKFVGRYVKTVQLGEGENEKTAHVFADLSGNDYYLPDFHNIQKAIADTVKNKKGEEVQAGTDLELVYEFEFKGQGKTKDGNPFNKIAYRLGYIK
jgi:hypothetical protein